MSGASRSGTLLIPEDAQFSDDDWERVFSEAEQQQAECCLAEAKLIATACELFALDHAGKFSTKPAELLPDYLAQEEAFLCPLAAEPHKYGNELLAGKDTDPGSNVLVRSRFTAPDGRRSVVYVNQWGTLEWR